MSFKIITEQEIVTTETTEVEVTLLGYIGFKVKEARIALDLKVSEVSRQLYGSGYHFETKVSKIEKGECPVKLQDLIAICDILEIGLGSVLPSSILEDPLPIINEK